jgi:hypothetical protein
MVPKNMTHLLQPLDLTTNGSLKKFEKKSFSNYFSSSITEALKADPNRDVTTIKVDLRLFVLKPFHDNVVKKVYYYFQTEKGQEVIMNGWRAAGITESLRQTREKQTNSVNLNPFF